MTKLIRIIIFSCYIAFFNNCFTVKYSFTGVQIHPDIKTASVQYIENRSPIIQPELSQQITDALKDKIESNTNLILVNGYGDINFEGEINRFITQPKSITANERAAQDRFTIGLKIKFTNTLEPDFDFNKSFDRYEEFESSNNFEDVRPDLTESIIDQLIEDIFNEAFVNW